MNLKNNKKVFSLFVVGIFTFSLVFFNFDFASGQTIEELEGRIQNQQDKIRALDAEIEKQRKLLLETAGERKDVESVISELEASRKKLQTSISQTQEEIVETELTIQKLALEIVDKKNTIGKKKETLSSTLKRINEMRDVTLIEVLLAHDNTSEFWNQITQLESFNRQIDIAIDNLRALNEELSDKKDEEENEKNQLELQKDELSGEQEAVESTKAEQDEILSQVKDKQQSYQQILNQKLAQKKRFEEEIFAIESQIQILIDKSKFPGAKSGIIGFPLEEPIVVTQRFGETAFAKSTKIYKGGSHPGTDFRAPIGTKIISVADGVVKAVGNTDAYPGCRAWGKWILIEHPNGLSSLYAHLSSSIVGQGQQVTRGQVIGFSGNTGIVVGPHLHFTLYASQGVRIVKYTGGGNCAAAGAIGPFADLDAYLDPEAYIPNRFTVLPGA